ncbi:MAG: hypothetical protein AAF991_09675, partial [Pseudomonadota bacterium]
LFQRVPYGEYRLQLAEESAETLGVGRLLSLSDGRSQFKLNREEDVVRYGTIKLAPADKPEAPTGESGPTVAALRPE